VQHLTLVRVELEVSIGHAAVEAGEFGVLLMVGKTPVECAQPGKDGFDQVLSVGALLADVAPAAGFPRCRFFAWIGFSTGDGSITFFPFSLEFLREFFGVYGVLTGVNAIPVQVFQSFEKEQVGDLFYGHQWIGEAGGPEAVPQLVNILAQMGGEHEVSS